MQTVVSYVKIKKIFRHHWRVVYTPVYKELGKGGSKDKFALKEIKRET
jgi:hypothetical protein